MADTQGIVVSVQDRVDQSIVTKLVSIAGGARNAAQAVTDLRNQLQAISSVNALVGSLTATQTAAAALASQVTQLGNTFNTLNNSTAQSVSILNTVAGAAQGAATGMQGVGQAAQQTGQAVQQATTHTQGFGGALANIGVGAAVFNTIKNAVVELGSELLEVVTKGYEVAKTFTEWRAQGDRVRIGLEQIAGSSQGAASYSAALNDRIQKLGLDARVTTDAFIKFAASTKDTALQGEETVKIFSAISEASSVLHLSTQQVELSFLAISQMASKGKVSMEELRRQLADHMPGALKLAADAMGVTVAQFDQMVASGKVVSEDFLPKFAEAIHKNYQQSIEEASEGAQASLNRMSTAWTNLERAIGQSKIGEVAKGQLDILTDAIDGVTQAMARAKQNGSGFWGQAAAAGGAVLSFLNPVNAFGYSAQSTEGLQKQIAQWQGELKNATGFYEKGQLAYNIKQAQDKLAGLMVNVPTNVSGSGANLNEAQLKEIRDKNNAANLQTYLDKGKLASPAETLKRHRTELKNEFDAAVKTMDVGSAQYLQAYATYQERLKALNDKAAAPGIRAAHRQQQNELSAQIVALEQDAEKAKALYNQQTQDLQTQLSNQVISQQQYIVQMGDARQKELTDLRNIAQQQADLASGKDQLSARQKFLAEVKKYNGELITEQMKTQTQLAALASKTRRDAEQALSNFQLGGQQRDSTNQNSLDLIGQGSRAAADLTALQGIMRTASQTRQQLTNQARKDGTQYSVEYVNGIAAITQAENDQLANEKLYFQQRNEMQSDWTNGVMAGLANISELSLNTAATTQQTFVQMFDGMASSIASFVTTGKLSFGNLVESMIQGIIKIQLQILASQAVGALLGAFAPTSFAGSFSNGGSQFTLPTSTNTVGGAPLMGLGGSTGFASGGYTGDVGRSTPAGVVHGQEFVVNARATAMPGVRPLLEALNKGRPGYAGGGFVGSGSSGGAAMSPNIVINNYAGSQVEASAQVSQDQNGNSQIEVVVRQIENQMAGNISKGKGPLHDSIRGKFGLNSRPGK